VISGLLRKDPGARPDADAVDWLLRRVASGPCPPPVPAAGAVPQPMVVATPQPQAQATDAGDAGPAADADNAEPAADAGPAVDAGGAGSAADADNAEPAADAEPVADAGNTGLAADFVPGFGPREHASTAAKSRVRKAWRQRPTTSGKAR
jgi:hypothetical protein